MKKTDSAKAKAWFKGLFVSTSDSEAKLLTVAKKDSTQTIISSVLCALLGILLGFIVLLCINPSHAGEAMGTILKNFGYYKDKTLALENFGTTVVKAVPLIMCGISVLFAYKAGLFNIGVGGQYCIGICVSLYSALAWQLPWYLCIVLAGLAAALWGAACGMLKAFFNVNEVIACIMTNWIGLYVTNLVLNLPGAKNPNLGETKGLLEFAPKSVIPDIGLRNWFNGNKYVTIAIPLCIIIAIIILVILNKTTFGYELKATGHNKSAAKYAGMKDKRNIILTMAISGALAGLGAAFFYLTGFEVYKTTSTSVPAMGFKGIAVAFLGGLNPIGAIIAGYFIQHITIGGGYIDTRYYNPEVADLMISLIVYLCAFVLFFKQFLTKRLNKISEKSHSKAQERAAIESVQDEVTPTTQDAAQADGTTVEENEITPEEEIVKEVNKEVEEITPPNDSQNTQKEDDER